MHAVSVSPWLRLGRVSNLPTVWTNSLAALVLSGASSAWVDAALSGAVMSLFYVAGMVLNDAFDAPHDRTHRPLRPIPAGEVSRRSTFIVGFGGLGCGVVSMAVLAQPGSEVGACLWGVVLAACIVFYDWYHKANPLSPVVMGACRALVFGGVAWMHTGGLPSAVVVAALLQWAYVVGLTYAAKQEGLQRPGALWPALLVFAGAVWFAAALTGWDTSVAPFSTPLLPVASDARVLTAIALFVFVAAAATGLAPLLDRPKRIGEAVGRLIAGIAVLDALFLASTGSAAACAGALLLSALATAGQRWVPGT